MADLSELIAYLLMGQPQQQAIAESDPYLGFQKNVAAPLSNAVLGAAQDKQYGTGEKVGAGLLTGLMSGLFGGLSQNYQTRAGDAYRNALFTSLQGGIPEKPSVLSPSLFAQAQGEAKTYLAKKEIEKAIGAEEAKAKKLSMAEEIVLKAETDKQAGRAVVRANAMGIPVAGLPTTPAPVAASLKDAPIGSAERLDQLLESLGDESVAEARFLDEIKGKREGDQAKKDSARKAEGDTYSRITNSPLYKGFSDIDANFKTLRSLADNEEPSAAPTMITAFGKINDPGSIIQPGEYKTISQNVQSLLDSIQGDWRQAFLGKTKLSPEARQAMVLIASEKYNQFGAKYGMERQQLLSALTQQGGEESNIPTLGFKPYVTPGTSPKQYVDYLKSQGYDPETARFMFKQVFPGL